MTCARCQHPLFAGIRCECGWSAESNMTKKELLFLMRLFASLESLMLAQKMQIPSHMLEQITEAVETLEREILK